MYTPGRYFRVVAHKNETGKDLNKILKTLYETAWKYFEELGESPAYFMPQPTGDTLIGYDFGEIKSSVRIDTASGKGVGQAERNDDLYLTEYSDWDRADEVYAGLVGSQPPGNPDNRLTIDFNPHGTGSDAYTKWTNAHLDETDKDYNGFTPFFAGVLDLPEYYTPEFLEAQEKTLQERMAAVYPRTPEEMWVQSQLCVHRKEDIENCIEAKYLCEFLSAAELERLDILHGVDTATGMPDGDWQVCITLGWYEDKWWEACAPLRSRIPEDVFAERVDARAREYRGTAVVERNVGSAVIVRLREIGTPGLYKHKHRDKDGRQRRQIGLPVTYGTKRQMISHFDRMLRDRNIGLVTPEWIQECREVEWKTTQDGEEAHGLAGAPDRQGANDDCWMAGMHALWGEHYHTGPAFG
jgi:hypothetical protein